MDNNQKNDSVKIGLSDIINGAALLFGLTAFCMLFVDCVKCTNVFRATTCFKGHQVVFGGVNGLLTFSFFNFLPFLLVLVASILSGLKFFGVDLSGKYLDWIIAGLFALAAVFFFVSPLALNFAQTDEARQFKNIYSFHMAVGLIVAAILSLLSALIVAAQKAFEILEKKGAFNVKK